MRRTPRRPPQVHLRVDRTGDLSAPGIRAEHGQRRPDYPAAGRSGGAAPRDLVPARATKLGCRVPRSAGMSRGLRQSWCGFELPPRLADRRIESADPETRRIATKYLEAHYLPRTASLSDRVAELTRRLLPTGQCSVDAIATNSPCIRGLFNDAWRWRACGARTSSSGNAVTKRRDTSPNRGCISARSRACLAIPSRAHSTGRAGVGSGRRLGNTEPN